VRWSARELLLRGMEVYEEGPAADSTENPVRRLKNGAIARLTYVLDIVAAAAVSMIHYVGP